MYEIAKTAKFLMAYLSEDKSKQESITHHPFHARNVLLLNYLNNYFDGNCDFSGGFVYVII